MSKTPIIKKIFSLLTLKQKKTSVALLCLMFIGMFLEVLGIGLVVPALVFMTQNDVTQNYPKIEPLLVFLGWPSNEQLIIICMLVIACVYTIKSCFLAFLAWQQSRFVFSLQASISKRLFKNYLHRPYIFHLQNNSAQLIRNATTEVSVLTNVVQSTLVLLTESIVLIGLMTLLMIVEPYGAGIIVIFFSLAAWFFYRLTRKHILRWGKIRQYHEGMRIQHLQQGLGAVKDVKLLGREDDFVFQYNQHNEISAGVGQRQSAFQQFPRQWLELLAIAGLVALVLIMIGVGKPIDALLPTLGVFAAAAFRLMPSVNRVLVALQGLRFAVPVINNLHGQLRQNEEDLQRQSEIDIHFKESLSLEQVNFKYPDVEAYALQDINIWIHRGTTVGFIGDSGAGKSTLVDIILGLLKPVSGSVLVDGRNVQSHMRGWQNQIGYVPQSIYLTDESLRSNIAFGLYQEEIDEDAVTHAIRSAQLEQFVSELPDGLDTVVGERGVRLSGGQRQRIGIARALYHDPAVLVLDEATSSLDTETESGVMESVRVLHGEKTIIIVAHRLSTVEHCDRIFRLERGKVIQEGESAFVLGTATAVNK